MVQIHHILCQEGLVFETFRFRNLTNNNTTKSSLSNTHTRLESARIIHHSEALHIFSYPKKILMLKPYNSFFLDSFIPVQLIVWITTNLTGKSWLLENISLSETFFRSGHQETIILQGTAIVHQIEAGSTILYRKFIRHNQNEVGSTILYRK